MQRVERLESKESTTTNESKESSPVERIAQECGKSSASDEDVRFAEGSVDLAICEDELDEMDEMIDDGDEEDDDGDEPPTVSRKVRRRSRRTRPRSKTIAMKRLTREELRLGALLNPPVDIPRPETRAECTGEARPCPWVACKHHLYLDVNPDTGSIKINFPDLEPWEMGETCALDVADRGGITLEEVGEIMNLTRERIRQVEVRGLLKLREASPSPEELGSMADEMQARHRKRKK